MNEMTSDAATAQVPQRQLMRKSRLAAVMTLYHQVSTEQPTAMEGRWSKNLETQEQLYQRRVTLTEGWVELDTGWLQDDFSTVVVENREGQGFSRIPTPEEKADSEARVVEISLRGDGVVDLRVLPGTLQPFFSSHRNIKLRCAKGRANCMISVVPR